MERKNTKPWLSILSKVDLTHGDTPTKEVTIIQNGTNHWCVYICLSRVTSRMVMNPCCSFVSPHTQKHWNRLLLPFSFFFTGVAAILYECRLGCLENNVPRETQDYISALNLMFSSFKTTMYAGAIPKWLRPLIPKPWAEFCSSWDGLFKFSA